MLNSLKKLEKRLHKPGITIGRPIANKPEHLNNYQVHLLLQTLGSKGYLIDSYDLWHPAGCSIAAQARNEIVDTFLKRDGSKGERHDYLLFIDDDQSFPMNYNPYDAFKALLDADKDIIGAMTVRKFPPHRLNISMFHQGGMRHIKNWPKDEPFKVHQLGFGMVLIKRHVIEKMYNVSDPPTPLFHNPLQFNPMTNKVELRGEDYIFCLNAMKLGFDIWVEPRIPLQHIGWYPFGIEVFEGYVEELSKNEEMLDICQDTHLYAELADVLKKSGQRSKKGPEKLSDVANAMVKQKGIMVESKLVRSATVHP